MNRSVAVEVTWAPWKLHRLPSAGQRYVTVGMFDEDCVEPPPEAWSVIIDVADDAAPSPVMRATARFLVEQAPHERLKSGVIFDLIEGARKSASVLVL